MVDRRRFFFDPENVDGEIVLLSQEETAHIKNVLRLSSGDEVELLDGEGTNYRVELDISGNRVVGRILETKRVIPENRVTLVLVQALLKGNRFDELLPQWTQLGVDAVFPVCSARSQVSLKRINTPKKELRWKKIVDNACKQSQRNIRLKVEQAVGFEEFIKQSGRREDGESRLLFWEDEKKLTLGDIGELSKARKVQIMVGPEGGFSAEEATLAQQCGWQTVSLGKRILKADTASITAVSLLQYLVGNLS